MSLKLFKVKDRYFDNKMEAKAFRNEHGGPQNNVFVQRGPDNPKSNKQGGIGRRKWRLS